MFNPLSCNAPVQPNYLFTCLIPEILLVNEALQLNGVRIWGKRLCSKYRDYFMVGECVRFLFTSCEGSLDERVNAAN